MFDPLTLGLIGGGIGALIGKNPLKGAAIGGGLGAAGGFAAPLFGGATGATGGLLGTAEAAGAVPAAAPAAAGVPGAAAQPGLLSQVSEYAKPIGQAASAASAVRGLVAPPQAPMQSPMPMQQMGGGQTLAALAGQNQQAVGNQMQMADQARIARRQQILKGGLL